MYGPVRTVVWGDGRGDPPSYPIMWTLDGAKDMLQLRASVKSRRFWSDFENLLPSSPPQQTDQIHLEAA